MLPSVKPWIFTRYCSFLLRLLLWIAKSMLDISNNLVETAVLWRSWAHNLNLLPHALSSSLFSSERNCQQWQQQRFVHSFDIVTLIILNRLNANADFFRTFNETLLHRVKLKGRAFLYKVSWCNSCWQILNQTWFHEPSDLFVTKQMAIKNFCTRLSPEKGET